MNKSTVSSLVLLAFLVLSLLSGCDAVDEQRMVGTLERDRVEIKVENNEPIRAIHVSDGQAVSAGTLILEQDPERAQALLARATGQRDQASARLAELKRGPRDELIREARAGLDAARATRINAEASLERTREVFEKGLSSEGQLDSETMRYETALAQQQAAKEALERLLNGTTLEELQQAEAVLLAAQADVRSALINLERNRLLAPVDGTVDKVLYQLGERPVPGATVAVLLDASRVFARVYVPAELRAAVQPGEKVDVWIDGVEGVQRGTVRWVSSDASFTPYFALTQHDRSRLSYLAEIDLPNASDLPSGLPLEAAPPGE
ncbi:MAG: HlyD family efflux transporter periplasmic adaptor subunit [Lysobacterales bacterium]|jgi:HlyD family secretion protein